MTSSENTVNIAVVLPLTGTFEANGVRHRKATQLAVSHLESTGDLIPGRKIRLVPIDAGDKVLTTQRNVEASLKDFALADGRVEIAGMVSSSAQEGALPLAIQNRVPHFEVAFGSDHFEFINDMLSAPDLSYAFSSRALCAPEAIMAADFIAKRWTSVCLLRGPQVHDRVHTILIRKRLNELAQSGAWTGTVANPADIEMTEDGPYEPYLRQCMGLSPRPGIVFWHLRGDSRNVEFMRAAQRVSTEPAPFDGQLVTCGMARKDNVLDPTNPGVVRYLDRRFWFVMRAPLKSDSLTRFKADFEAFAGEKADTFTVSAYDAAMAIGLAVAAAGSSDGPRVRDALRQVTSGGTKFGYGQHAEALAAIRAGQDIDWDGGGSSLEFDKDGNVEGRFYVEEVQFDPAANEGKGWGKYVELSDPAPQVLSGGWDSWSGGLKLSGASLLERMPCPCSNGE
ncbi:MAG: ABC transporter substrate-binding protein [Deltaproteobacteria bacterium]|nr:ABC transporter substrate-binding protein [Deltaproteobacteria bacterium]